jgi:two-component system sensor histidine kinase RegB
MWVAFTVGAAFIVYFVTRVKAALAERDVALDRAREVATASERLAALATVAGGAAHELATPLGTIAVIAKELELELVDHQIGGSAIEDVQLIRSQVNRCRKVLNQLSIDVGQAPGEASGLVVLEELIEVVLESVARRSQVEVSIPPDLETFGLRGFPSAMEQTIRAVIRNALDASSPDLPVVLHATRTPGGLLLSVRDQGVGMSAETLSRASEPFFSTKPAGAGMGLGLFLGRTVLERQGGSLSITSSPGEGTTVDLLFPTEENDD